MKIWDLHTGREVFSLEGHLLTVYGVAFSPCGRRIATGGQDRTLMVWDGTPVPESTVR